ncbi:hypothetical protein ES707_14171 [subsurface metagenome]
MPILHNAVSRKTRNASPILPTISIPSSQPTRIKIIIWAMAMTTRHREYPDINSAGLSGVVSKRDRNPFSLSCTIMRAEVGISIKRPKIIIPGAMKSI